MKSDFGKTWIDADEQDIALLCRTMQSKTRENEAKQMDEKRRAIMTKNKQFGESKSRADPFVCVAIPSNRFLGCYHNTGASYV
jgi:hypothetical protein